MKHRQLDVLVVLVSRAGELVTKEALTAAVCGPDTAVTGNRLAQLVARLRRLPPRYFARPVNPWASMRALKTASLPTMYSVLFSGPAKVRFWTRFDT